MNFCFAVPKGLEHVAYEDILQNIGDVGTFTATKGSGFVFLACNSDALGHAHTAIKINNANLLGVESCYIVLGICPMPKSVYEDTDTERFLDWVEESVQDKAIFAWDECLVTMRHFVSSLSNHVTSDNLAITTDTKDPLRFRASFEKNNHKHTLASQNIAGAIGKGVLDLFRERWRVDLKHYDLEIFSTWFMATTGTTSTLESSPFYSQSTGLSLAPPDTCDLLFLLAITIPMAHSQANYRNRIVFGRTAMRPTIAHCLVRMASPQPGDIVLDPCCGVGTIPIEGAYAYPTSFFIGGEVYGPAVCESARANVRHAKVCNVDLMQVDARKIHLRNQCVDLVVSDLPWGMREGSFKQTKKLYPALIKELYRVLRPCGRALLVTQGHKVMNHVLEEQWCANMFNLERKIEVTIGYKVYLYVLTRK